MVGFFGGWYPINQVPQTETFVPRLALADGRGEGDDVARGIYAADQLGSVVWQAKGPHPAAESHQLS